MEGEKGMAKRKQEQEQVQEQEKEPTKAFGFKLPRIAVAVINVLHGRALMEDTEGKISGRQGPGSVISQAILYLLGASDEGADNPLITGEAREMGLSLREKAAQEETY